MDLTQANLLEMRQITKTFPGVTAVDRVDFSCRQGEIHGLIGENGAGKSTLVKILAGAYHADDGEIVFDGEGRRFTSPHDAQQAGIGIIYQEFTLLPNMSVADNIYLGREILLHGVVNHRRMKSEALKILDRLGGNIRAQQLAGQLTVAQQQRVEIAKALSLDARLIIMDEPSAALGGHELDMLFEIIRSLKSEGVTLIYISHRLSEIFEICDRVTVLKDGERVGVKVVAETDESELVRMMVGRDFEDVFPPLSEQANEHVVLKVGNLSCGEGVQDVTFDIRSGEVLGIAGLAGSGQTELVRAIFGADSDVKGDIELNDEPVHKSSPKRAIEAGITMAPEDRKAHGLLLGMAVGKNITLPILKRFLRFLGLSSRKETETVERLITNLDIRITGHNQKVGHLSGGNQQKVVLAKCLGCEPKVLILDDPTRGVDVGAKFEIYRLIRNLANSGAAILFISSELPEIMGMSDRILVLSRGRLMGILDGKQATEERIMELATGTHSQVEAIGEAVHHG
jgi:ribose transport system ATP-binding protein